MVRGMTVVGCKGGVAVDVEVDLRVDEAILLGFCGAGEGICRTSRWVCGSIPALARRALKDMSDIR